MGLWFKFRALLDILENGDGEGTNYVYNVNTGLLRDTVIKAIE